MNYPSFDQPAAYSNNNISYPGMQMYPGPPPIQMQPVPFHHGAPPVIINNMGGTKCQFCGGVTENVQRKSCGCVATTWGVGLFLFFFPLFWLPCCIDGCKDTQFVCSNCRNVKNTIPATCC